MTPILSILLAACSDTEVEDTAESDSDYISGPYKRMQELYYEARIETIEPASSPLNFAGTSDFYTLGSSDPIDSSHVVDGYSRLRANDQGCFVTFGPYATIYGQSVQDLGEEMGLANEDGWTNELSLLCNSSLFYYGNHPQDPVEDDIFGFIFEVNIMNHGLNDRNPHVPGLVVFGMADPAHTEYLCVDEPEEEDTGSGLTEHVSLCREGYSIAKLYYEIYEVLDRPYDEENPNGQLGSILADGILCAQRGGALPPPQENPWYSDGVNQTYGDTLDDPMGVYEGFVCDGYGSE